MSTLMMRSARVDNPHAEKELTDALFRLRQRYGTDITTFFDKIQRARENEGERPQTPSETPEVGNVADR